MRAVRFHRYGSPEVLVVDEVDPPTPGANEVRIAVQASSVNPMDIKLRAGYLAEYMPVEFPSTVGSDAAGVVDAVGDDVEGVQPGDLVFGIGQGTAAEYAVLGAWAAVPSGWSAAQAAGAGIVASTAIACLDALGDIQGKTMVIDGAAGGVGSAAAQIAIARGASVIGTASESNHDFLRSLGVIPTNYGDGLVSRVQALAPHVHAAIDTAGAGSLSQLVELAGDPANVVTINDPQAEVHSVRMVINNGDIASRLREAASLGASGEYSPTISQTFAFADAASAHAHIENGHARGKTILQADS